jgi:hypothetical protein
MPAKRKLKPRPTYRQHSEAVVLATVKQSIPRGGVFFDFLTDIRLEPVIAATEYDRGRAEGVREFAAQLQDMALSDEVAEGD